MTSSYITSAATAQQLPPPGLPEIAFIGRSNCGKSSLLNALLERKGLARTSRTPGRTQMANFFATGRNKIFVDLPGYGYSKLNVKLKKSWEGLLDAYLDRPSLEICLVLHDARRDITDEDMGFLAYLESKAPLVFVLTKTDKLSKTQAQQALDSASKRLTAGKIQAAAVVKVSSLKKQGIDELRRLLLDTSPTHQRPLGG